MKTAALFAFSLSLLAAQSAIAAQPVTGRWVTAEKDSIVEIAACGVTICGRIAKIHITRPGDTKNDSANPDPNLRNRTILGLTILSGFKDNGKDWKGTIYDPRSGKTYKSYISRAANGNLIVKGCIGPFCSTYVWTPAK